MGLAVAVGALADLLINDSEGAGWLDKSLAAVNQLLAKEGLPSHAEPRALALPARRNSIRSFPYSYIHHLRRAYAHRRADPAWTATPLGDHARPIDDPVLGAELDMLRSHLLCHSDAEGFYVPVDFRDVLAPGRDEPRIPGGLLGSSHRLLEELVQVAPALGIRLAEGRLTDQEAVRVDALASSGEGLHRELCAWLALFEAARLSVELKTAVVFS